MCCNSSIHPRAISRTPPLFAIAGGSEEAIRQTNALIKRMEDHDSGVRYHRNKK